MKIFMLFIPIVLFTVLISGCISTPTTCQEKWVCSSWSECQADQQTRTCTEQNSCSTTQYKPIETKACGAGELQEYNASEYTNEQSQFYIEIMNQLIRAFSNK